MIWGNAGAVVVIETINTGSAPPAANPFPGYAADTPRQVRRHPVADFGSINLDLLGKDALPFRQADWLNPRAPDRRGRLDAPLNLLGTTLRIVQTPFSQSDWPNPRLPGYSIALRSWTQSFDLSLIGKDALPFRQSDWPNPRVTPPGVALKSWLGPLNIELLGKDFLPFRETDWPNPRIKGRSASLLTISSSLFLANQKLFVAGQVISMRQSSPTAVNLFLPPNPAAGKLMTIVDTLNVSASHNFTVKTLDGSLIMGSPTYVIGANAVGSTFEAAGFLFDGIGWMLAFVA